MRGPNELEADDRAPVERLCHQSADIEIAYPLFQAFMRIVRERHLDALDSWLCRAAARGLIDLPASTCCASSHRRCSAPSPDTTATALAPALQWLAEGIPHKPAGWLFQVALRREKLVERQRVELFVPPLDEESEAEQRCPVASPGTGRLPS